MASQDPCNRNPACTPRNTARVCCREGLSWTSSVRKRCNGSSCEVPRRCQRSSAISMSADLPLDVSHDRCVVGRRASARAVLGPLKLQLGVAAGNSPHGAPARPSAPAPWGRRRRGTPALASRPRAARGPAVGDAMRIAHAAHRDSGLKALTQNLLAQRDVEVPEDLDPETYRPRAAVHVLPTCRQLILRDRRQSLDARPGGIEFLGGAGRAKSPFCSLDPPGSHNP